MLPLEYRYEHATDLTRHYSSAGPPEDWAGNIPNVGYLTLDYVSHKEAPTHASCATAEELTSVLVACGTSFKDGVPELPEGVPAR